LERAYGYERKDIAAALEKVLRTAEFLIEDAEAAWAGLKAYQRQRADFADVVIARSNRARGCEVTATFDRRAARMDGFELA
jgi:predicted nucleic-acid-binding protein